MRMIGAVVPEDSISSAAMGLGVDLASVTRSGVARAALALFHGMPKDEAKQFVRPNDKKARLGSDGQDFIGFRAPDELIDVGDHERSYAIRVGLAMAAGLTRKEAESWAKMSRGRPPKEHAV